MPGGYDPVKYKTSLKLSKLARKHNIDRQTIKQIWNAYPREDYPKLEKRLERLLRGRDTDDNPGGDEEQGGGNL